MTPDALVRSEAKFLREQQKTALFRLLCKREGIPEPTLEYPFAKPERNWRFDLAWLEQKVALEVDGGVFTMGRHTRGKGFEADITKLNWAVSHGWRVFRTTPARLENFETLRMIKQALQPLGPTSEDRRRDPSL